MLTDLERFAKLFTDYEIPFDTIKRSDSVLLRIIPPEVNLFLEGYADNRKLRGSWTNSANFFFTADGDFLFMELASA